jgi:hypothetical protein
MKPSRYRGRTPDDFAQFLFPATCAGANTIDLVAKSLNAPNVHSRRANNDQFANRAETLDQSLVDSPMGGGLGLKDFFHAGR